MLSNEQTETFKRDGFLLVRSLYSAEDMKQIIDWTEEVSNFPEVPGKYMMYFEQNQLMPEERILSRIEDFEPYHNGFSKLLINSPLSESVSDLFGEDAVLFKDKINFQDAWWRWF